MPNRHRDPATDAAEALLGHAALSIQNLNEAEDWMRESSGALVSVALAEAITRGMPAQTSTAFLAAVARRDLPVARNLARIVTKKLTAEGKAALRLQGAANG